MPRPSRSTRSAPVVIAAGAVKRPNRTAKRVVRQSSETEKAKRDVEPEPKLLGAPSLLPPILHFSLSEAVSHLSTHDRRFGTMFDRIPCKPFAPPYEPIDPFRTLVTSIIGQQVSWLAARAINKRFQALFGYDDGFPTPWEITKKEPLELKGVGLSMRKAEYVISLAEHFVSGALSTELLANGTDEEVAKALIAVRGIGQWTVDMFSMFSLRRPDILPVGDLGVQKGLLRWALAAHGALPKSKTGKGEAAKAKYGLQVKVDAEGQGEIDTVVRDTTPERKEGDVLPPTPSSPGHVAALHTPAPKVKRTIPPTPVTPGEKPDEALEVPTTLPLPAADTLLLAPADDPTWDANQAAPLPEGLTVEVMKARLGGKKAKGGAYLTPTEMDALTQGWRPYRSLGVYYMWPAGEEW